MLFATTLFAQQGTNAAGGEASGPKGSVSPVLVHILYEFMITLSAADIDDNDNPTTFIYPNPATNFIVLKVEDSELASLTCQLCDMQGNIIVDKKLKLVKPLYQLLNYLIPFICLKC